MILTLPNKIYISSADFMTRNTVKRVEIAVPIYDEDIKNKIQRDFDILLSDNVKLVGLALIITAIALFLIKDFKGKKDKSQITILDSIIIGLFQAVALFPGISRSGATIVGGMSTDLKRQTAVNYSFMLYLPISVATLILGVKDLFATPNLSSLMLPYFLGMIASP